jgi:hypothetical protein
MKNQSDTENTAGGSCSSRALFIPLRGVYFDQFERGEKRTEYRQRGPRWNAETCAIGRRVVLSRGYGKQKRLTGTITGFSYDTIPSKLPGWLECYGPNSGDAACITIQIDGMNASVEQPGPTNHP